MGGELNTMCVWFKVTAARHLWHCYAVVLQNSSFASGHLCKLPRITNGWFRETTLTHLHSFGLRVQARGVKAVRVDARRICWVWAGRGCGQDVRISRVLQAAGRPRAAQAAHAAAALATCTHTSWMRANVRLLYCHVHPSLCRNHFF